MMMWLHPVALTGSFATAGWLAGVEPANTLSLLLLTSKLACTASTGIGCCCCCCAISPQKHIGCCSAELFVSVARSCMMLCYLGDAQDVSLVRAAFVLAKQLSVESFEANVALSDVNKYGKLQ